MRNKYDSISDVDRRRIVEAYLSGQSAQMVAKVMGAKRTTVNTIIGKFLKEGRIEAKKRGGEKAHKLTDEQKLIVRSWVDDDCSISLAKLKEKCFTTFGVDVSEATISRFLKTSSYTVKRTHLQPKRLNDAETIETRWQYAQSFLQLFAQVSETHIYFIDEVGFNVAASARRGRSLRGTWAEQVAPDLSRRDISVGFAMNSQRLLHYSVQTRTYNREHLCTFLEALILMFAERGVTNAVLVMDNVQFPKREQLRSLIESHGHRVLYLPPYSPFLNPIENMLSKWKDPHLLQLINAGATTVTSDDCSTFFKHMMVFITRCLNRETIVDE